ncbi:MAG: hypothetical protein ACO3QN_02300 [Bacilli bacterium]
MPWWGYVLIGLAVVVIGYLKLKVWGAMTKKKPPVSPKDED